MMLWGRRLREIERRLDHVIRLLEQQERAMTKELDDLAAQVHSNSGVLDSAVTLINGIAARITAAGTDPAKLQALTDELKSKDDALAAAVAANTPAAPVPLLP